MNPYMNKELLYTELIVLKDKSTKLLSKRYEVFGSFGDHIEAWTTSGIRVEYSKDYLYGEEIKCKDSNFYHAFSDDEVEYILAQIQIVSKYN